MSKNATLDSLFLEWKDRYTPGRFCSDGIVDEAKYARADRRLLFVLKEVNQKLDDLRPFLSRGPEYQIWHATARWAAAILRCFPCYEKIDSYEVMQEALSSSAVINLKKTWGGSWSNAEVINAYAHADAELIKKEIKIIDPTIIVAGGTFSYLVWLLDLPVDPDEPQSTIVHKGKVKIVPFRHPTRANNRQTYAELKRLMGCR